MNALLFRTVGLAVIATGPALAVDRSNGTASQGSSASDPGVKSPPRKEGAVQPAQLEETIVKPPFGLTWKEDAENLEKLLKGAKATIVDRAKEGNHEVWRVEGLVQTGLKATLFEMVGGKLSSISLIYQREEWGDEKYLDFYGEVKKRIAVKYGAPAREGSEHATEFNQLGDAGRKSLQEATWRRSQTGIRLLYSQKDDDTSTRTLKVQYAASLP